MAAGHQAPTLTSMPEDDDLEVRVGKEENVRAGAQGAGQQVEVIEDVDTSLMLAICVSPSLFLFSTLSPSNVRDMMLIVC